MPSNIPNKDTQAIEFTGASYMSALAFFIYV
jgi:hypothetical protein